MIQFVEEWPPTRSRFRPGQSGNPGGRPKAIRLALRKAAKHSPRAILVLVEIMNDAKQDPFARLAAAKLILDRGLGKLKEVELPPEAAEEREIAAEELRYMLRVARIDHYQQEGWRIPPDLSRYEAALRILRPRNLSQCRRSQSSSDSTRGERTASPLRLCLRTRGDSGRRYSQ
jgi:hypothetical protein